MNHQLYDLKYDREADRWMVHMDDHAYGLHCGECFNLHIGDLVIPCRLEYSQQWYVIMHNTSFGLRIRATYKVEL